jgi:large subunit ribosomal protein L13
MKNTAPTRATIEIDAEGQAIGRIATQAAYALQGKNHATYVPHIDSGDFVIIKNAGKLKITGKKLEQKTYYHYSGYPGGIKSKLLGTVMAKDPGDAIARAVSRMLPKNRLRTPRLKRLTVHN